MHHACTMLERFQKCAAALGIGRAPDAVAADPQAMVMFCITQWPELDEAWRTARALRALSVMSVRPVTLRWMTIQTGWSDSHAQAFLVVLDRAHCLRQSSVSCRAAELPGAGQAAASAACKAQAAH